MRIPCRIGRRLLNISRLIVRWPGLITLRRSAVEGDELDTQQIVARSNTSRHVEVVPTSVGNHRVHSPFSVTQTVLGNLEPLKACGASSCGIVYLGKVVLYRPCGGYISYLLLHDRESYHEAPPTFVARSNRMIGIVSTLLSTYDVSPPVQRSQCQSSIQSIHRSSHHAPTFAPAGMLITVLSVCLMSLLQAKAASLTFVIG